MIKKSLCLSSYWRDNFRRAYFPVLNAKQNINIILEENQYEIRPWRVQDADDIAAAVNNKNVLKNLRDGLPFPYTKEDGLDYINTMFSSDKNTTFAFAITIDDKVIGSIGAFAQGNIHSRTAELGYYVAEPYWGKGIGSSAVKKLCDYVFANTNIIRIFAEPFAYNTASCKVLEKNGFQCEGTLRSNAVKDGQIIDMKMYSLIKE